MRENNPDSGCVDVEILSLSAGGDAVARHEGKVIFVAGGCPGDRVRVRRVQQGKRFDRGEIEEVLVPGPWRVEPPCPVFGLCGGCQWQHIAYARQVQEKQSILLENLRRLGGVEPPEVACVTDHPTGYRIRARLFRDGRGVFGFRRERGHDAVDARDCVVMHPELLRASRQVGAWMASQKRVGEIDVGVAPGGGVAVWLHDAATREHLDSLMAACEGLQGAVAGSGDARCVVGDPNLPLGAETPWGAVVHPIDAFWQANGGMNVKALEGIAYSLADLPGAGGILELFAGSGNITRVLAASGRPVTAVEQHPMACERLSAWAVSAGVPVAVWQGEAHEGLIRACREGAPVSAVVLDPPRAGLGETVGELVALGPSRIIYLSCDTATLARDVRVLAASGYRLTHAAMLDFFPQTHHVESLLVMER